MNKPRDLILISIRPSEAALPCIIDMEAEMASKPTPPAPVAVPADLAPVAAEPLKISTAIAHRIHTGGRRGAGPSLLDFVLVLGVLLIIGGVLFGLFDVTDLKATLPIIASMASALISAVISGYAAYRWGASDAMKKAIGPGA